MRKLKCMTRLAIFAVYCILPNFAMAQFVPFGSATGLRTNSNNQVVGIGNFPNLAGIQAVLHVNSNLTATPSFINKGEVFRTECPANNTTTWKMFRGSGTSGEKVRISSPVLSAAGGGNDVVIENRQKGAMLFGTGLINRMIILDGPGADLLTGFVGIGNNFYAPKSQLHVSDGANDTYMQITNNFTNSTAADGFRFGVLSTGEVLLNQQENMPMWFNVGGIPKMQILSSQPYVGIGDYNNFVPKNMLHIHDGQRPAYVQFTNLGTTPSGQPSATDGLLVGIDNSGEADINHQQAYAINFKTNNTQRAIIDKDGHMGIGAYTSADPLTFPLHVYGMQPFLSSYGWNRAIKIENHGALVWDASGQLYNGSLVRHFFMAHPALGGNEGDFFAGFIPSLNGTTAPDYVYRIFGVNRTDKPLQGTFQYLQYNVLVNASQGIGSSHLFPQRNLDVFNGSLPQLRLSQTVSNLPSILPTDGVYTDFTTTSAADLLIEPFSLGTPGKVGINISSLDPQPTTELDVDGNGRFRGLPLSSSTRIVVATADGTLGYNDNLVLGGGADFDWEFLNTGGTSDGVYSGHSTPNYNNKGVYVGIDPNQISLLPYPSKFAVYNTVGGQGNPDFGSVSGTFIVNFLHPSSGISSECGIYSKAFGSGGANTSTSNYGGLFLAQNAFNNYGADFFAGNPLATSAQGINYGGKFSAVNGVRNYGISCDVSSNVSGVLDNYGGVFHAHNAQLNNLAGYFDAQGASYNGNVGIHSQALGGASNYAIHGYANNATSMLIGDYAGYFDGNVHIQGNVTISGSGTIPGGTWQGSDIILKQNIDSISNALNFVRQLKPSKFNFDTIQYSFMNLPSGHQYGFIAQDVASIVPTLVKDIVYPAQKDTLGNVIVSAFTYKALNYSGLIPIAIKGIQELDTKINNLQTGSSGWSGAGTGSMFTTDVNDKINIGGLWDSFDRTKFSVLNNSNIFGAYIRSDISTYLKNTFGIIVESNGLGSSIGGTFSSSAQEDAYGLTVSSNSQINSIGLSVRTNSISQARGGEFITDCSNGQSFGLNLSTYATNNNSYGILSYTSATNGTAFGIYSYVNDRSKDFAGYFNGNTQVNGNLYVSGTYPGSDNKLKENVQPVTNAMSIINQLLPKTFNFKTSQYTRLNLPEGNQFGLIAQDVEPILPDLVKNVHLPQEFDSLGNVIADSLNYKALNYTALIPVLIQGLKETKSQNDSLKTVIANYEARFANIETMLANCCQNTNGKTMNSNSSEGLPLQGSGAGEGINNTDISSVIHITPDNSINSPVTELYQNRPNPFTVKTTFTYQLGKTGFVELEIHSELGAFVAKLVDMNQEEGSFSIDWNTNDIAPGIYFYSLKVDGQLWVKKAVRIK